ncbi:unnamed protein product [Protopolystoma xenopodis]|uniref:Uncharacterized protein n=1 Tax=Protopolystoma xenopodis TaxID=117903 RepID=A0A448WXN7_9PLAT|nr:unnamed protein product [Protopolystoma xenopodis]
MKKPCRSHGTSADYASENDKFLPSGPQQQTCLHATINDRLGHVDCTIGGVRLFGLQVVDRPFVRFSCGLGIWGTGKSWTAEGLSSSTFACKSER